MAHLSNSSSGTNSVNKQADKLTELANLCKASVSVTFNEHTTNYETVEEYVDQLINSLNLLDKKPDDFDKMVTAQRVVEVHFYCHTPIGFFHLVGYDLDKLLDQAIVIAKEEANK